MLPNGGRSDGLKVLFLTSGPNAPASRYRVFQYLPHLQQLGFRCSIANSFPEKYDYFPLIGWRCSRFLKRLVRRWHLLQIRWTQPDLVVLERELFDEPTDEFEQKLRRLSSRLVLDIDDGIFLRYPEKFERLTRMCDGVIAGNALLRDYARALNSRVVVIPTCVDIDLYPQVVHAETPKDRTVIGWIGTPSNIPQLSLVLPALRTLSQQSAIELRIVTSGRECLSSLDTSGIDFRFIPWNASTAVDEIRQFDIGVMPLNDDDEWNRYKCGLKLIEYMAVGIPAVASSVGVNSEIVASGINGFLAATPADWVDHLSRLTADGALRHRIGRAGRSTVISRYSIQSSVPLLAKAFTDFAEVRSS
jgi:glycosyltransferase involved in cell wall biosynthesis